MAGSASVGGDAQIVSLSCGSPGNLIIVERVKRLANQGADGFYRQNTPFTGRGGQPYVRL